MDRQAAPYHFIPVDPQLAVHDVPSAHDTLDLSDPRWTGELRCTLTALTPLLAANDQYSVAVASAAVRDRLRELVEGRLPRGVAVDEEKFARKAILEPLALPGDDLEIPGAVLISGTQIKGMIRQS